MPRGVSRPADRSLHFSAAPPTGIGLCTVILIVVALFALITPLMNAGVPALLLTCAASVTGSLVMSIPTRRVELTDGGRLLVTGFGQDVDIEAGRITAISLPRRARLGFGCAAVHGDGGRFRMWHNMKYTPQPRSTWSFRYVSGRGGKDFGELVYRLRLHNPALAIEGVEPPLWARPWSVPRPPYWP
jgi:hypothetical protein